MKLAGKKGWLHHVLCACVCAESSAELVFVHISSKQVGMAVICHRPRWQSGVLQNWDQKILHNDVS